MNIYEIHSELLADELAIELRRDGYAAHTERESEKHILVTEAEPSLLAMSRLGGVRHVNHIGRRI